MSMCLTQTQTLPKNKKKLLEALRERGKNFFLLLLMWHFLLFFDLIQKIKSFTFLNVRTHIIWKIEIEFKEGRTFCFCFKLKTFSLKSY